MSKQIPLTRGKCAIVDDQDFERVSQFKWAAACPNGTNWYAVGWVGPAGKKRFVRMHRFILDAEHGIDVDHRDGDGLNNQRANIRLCSSSQNHMNKPKSPKNQSGFKGVTRHRKCWRVRIGFNYQRIRIGGFQTAEEAARAYDILALQYHGEFAQLNFPEIRHAQ